MMPDPVSLIALAAAVGGVAGKFAEKTWEISERWLSERFGSHAEAARNQARGNAADFVRQLAGHIKALEDGHSVDQRQIDASASHPQFSSLLQRTVLNAAETAESEKHDLLAQLIAIRLQSKAETTLSLASKLASDAITRSTHRQLTLMAVRCFFEGIRPRKRLTLTQYKKWIAVCLDPFIDFEFHVIDAKHLVAIACATYDPTSEQDLGLMLTMKATNDFFGEVFDDIAAVEALEIQWIEGLGGVTLTSVGAIVGGLAFDQITGLKCGMPKWD